MTEGPPRPDTVSVGSDRVPSRRRSAPAAFALWSGRTLVALLSAVVLTLTWYGSQVLGELNSGLTTTDVIGGGFQKKPLDGAVDILLVGQDSRTDNDGNPLPREVLDMLHGGKADGERQTDTMILVHIPQNGERAVAISFPRDSLVELSGGYGKHKLNSAFVYAYNDTASTLQQQGEADLKKVDEQAKVAGRKNLISTIETLIGKPGMIDRYAEVNLLSFYEVTQAIGGVEVCLNQPVKEWRSGVDLPAGLQTVQGKQALSFVRQRYDLPNGDLDRIARQQAFLSGLARKVLSPDVLMSPARITDVINAVKKSVILSKDWDLLEFAEQMRGMTGGNVEFRTIPTEGNGKFGGADIVKIDNDKVKAFVDELTEDGTGAPVAPTTGAPDGRIPGAEKITADVFNASGNATTANQLKELLRAKGFQEGASTQLDGRSTTVVRFAPGEQDAADAIKQAMGDRVQTEPDADVPAGHVRVLLGRDYKVDANGAAGAGQSSTTPPPPSEPEEPAAPPAETPPAGPPPITAGGVPCVN
ncbi:LCP family protein [Amycolatopsis albispora]|uniref:LytTR family transcriptional regulator n=1 Tax=Amycolatopsis albispora TaxID=1804986 RepID=A0A344LLY2_9PSEU|nr:LCP family protein [Amycolatopsis albispora]AXB49056.1 LytTR family transcriptional regulator [Amycolatopsis albispora]